MVKHTFSRLIKQNPRDLHVHQNKQIRHKKILTRIRLFFPYFPTLRIINRLSYFPTFGIIILIRVSTSLTITYEEYYDIPTFQP